MKRNVTIFQVCYIFKTNPNFIKAERDLEIAMFMLGCGSELNVGDYQAIHLIHNLVPEPLKEGENYDQDYLDQYHELGKVYFSAIEVFCKGELHSRFILPHIILFSSGQVKYDFSNFELREFLYPLFEEIVEIITEPEEDSFADLEEISTDSAAEPAPGAPCSAPAPLREVPEPLPRTCPPSAKKARTPSPRARPPSTASTASYSGPVTRSMTAKIALSKSSTTTCRAEKEPPKPRKPSAKKCPASRSATARAGPYTRSQAKYDRSCHCVAP